MKLKFKVQPYQTDAVNNVVDIFEGQPKADPLSRDCQTESDLNEQIGFFDGGFRNAEIILSNEQILENIHKIQSRRDLPLSRSLTDFTKLKGRGERVPADQKYILTAQKTADIHLDVEMETGTGKTYCYIKAMFEMHERYGWSKFIVVVPLIGICEGVYKSLQITADHFAESYGKKARFYIYNSRSLSDLESFSSDAGISVLVINIQAFNSTKRVNRRIYEELDEFQSRKPIEVIASTRPILILDEPHRLKGEETIRALPKFCPLFVLRYSATHSIQHNLVHRLDALDAYNRKLVKKIAVRGIQTRGLAGTNVHLHLEGIDTRNKEHVARMFLDVMQKSGDIKPELRLVKKGDSLFEKSGNMEQYRGFRTREINADNDMVEFMNGIVLKVGEPYGDVSIRDMRRIQIRETIRAHLEKEEELFAHGIKVLSLFFIDEVSKYRDQSQLDGKGEYARIFEEQYEQEKEKI